MNRLQLITPDGLRRISTKARRLISITVGVLIAAVVGGVVGGLDYLAFIADLHHRHEIDAFAFHYLDYLLAKVITGAILGALIGVIGVLLGASKKFGARKTDVRIALGIVIVGGATCVAFVVLAAFGIAVHGPVGPQGFTSPGDFLIGPCSFAAGLIVGAVRSGD
ncbi:hypothetical protein [Actinomadura citrea]|jgi:hypothetical protein|uniref:Phage shock protein PspC (Stress-responsive transcriptional regulator) n=1 Tax=Actinomadura citrea TaxID=46158 RepID=A0A7Y9GHE1_9ACTN|nr:hypothetical protein [Actinomadura citrea]NYE16391.1 phage shock protein PspC (stress-responsive transcriptional regulator) [Actinomadura citrea]GGT95344.1 hypothetical protein GCM10010177_62990 [Actinomadura citrea]